MKIETVPSSLLYKLDELSKETYESISLFFPTKESRIRAASWISFLFCQNLMKLTAEEQEPKRLLDKVEKAI